MKNEKTQQDTRQSILKAASQLILTEGVARLTLEAVAKKAGVSKGGLLYHFPSKEALIAGLVESVNDEFNAELAQFEANEPVKSPGSWLRAYIRACSDTDSELLANSSALIATIATNPELLEPFRQSFVEYQRQAERAGIDPVLATIIRLAADGLWLAELFNLAPPTGALREQVLAKLMEMSQTKPNEPQGGHNL